MKRDVFGICLSKSLLSQNLSSTFTHVRAYTKSELLEDARVCHAYPQMSGQDLLSNMQTNKNLIWRAEYICRIGK